MNKKGIAVAGNMIVDMLYPISNFPKPGELVTVTGDMSRSTGGCLCNDIVDLAKLDPSLPLVALGRVGEDAEGEYIMGKLREHKNIDLQYVKAEGTTSYTLVLAAASCLAAVIVLIVMAFRPHDPADLFVNKVAAKKAAEEAEESANEE